MSNSSSSTSVRNVAYIAVFAALIIVFAFVSIPTASGVPIVLQNAIVILTGLVLGARRGFLSVALFLGLGLIGLPVLAGGRTTLAALAGPTVGYIVGYLVAVIVAGALAYGAMRAAKKVNIVGLAIAGVAALTCQYLCGIVGLILKAGMTTGAAFTAQAPFIVPDLIKVAVVVGVAAAVHAAFPHLAKR